MGRWSHRNWSAASTKSPRASPSVTPLLTGTTLKCRTQCSSLPQAGQRRSERAWRAALGLDPEGAWLGGMRPARASGSRPRAERRAGSRPRSDEFVPFIPASASATAVDTFAAQANTRLCQRELRSRGSGRTRVAGEDGDVVGGLPVGVVHHQLRRAQGAGQLVDGMGCSLALGVTLKPHFVLMKPTADLPPLP